MYSGCACVYMYLCVYVCFHSCVTPPLIGSSLQGNTQWWRGVSPRSNVRNRLLFWPLQKTHTVSMDKCNSICIQIQNNFCLHIYITVTPLSAPQPWCLLLCKTKHGHPGWWVDSFQARSSMGVSLWGVACVSWSAGRVKEGNCLLSRHDLQYLGGMEPPSLLHRAVAWASSDKDTLCKSAAAPYTEMACSHTWPRMVGEGFEPDRTCCLWLRSHCQGSRLDLQQASGQIQRGLKGDIVSQLYAGGCCLPKMYIPVIWTHITRESMSNTHIWLHTVLTYIHWAYVINIYENECGWFQEKEGYLTLPRLILSTEMW